MSSLVLQCASMSAQCRTPTSERGGRFAVHKISAASSKKSCSIRQQPRSQEAGTRISALKPLAGVFAKAKCSTAGLLVVTWMLGEPALATTLSPTELAEFMPEFTSCVSNTCLAEMIVCDGDDACMATQPCVEQCMVMKPTESTPTSAKSRRVSMPKTQVQKVLRKITEELSRDIIDDAVRIEKAATDYETPRFTPGPVGGVF